MTIKEYTRKNILESIRVNPHIANGYHIGATREELLLRLEDNSNLQYASTILIDPEDMPIFAKKLAESIPNDKYLKLYKWYREAETTITFKIVVPFPEDIADYWITNRNGNDIDAKGILLVFDKMYCISKPFSLLTLYPIA